MSTVDMVAYLIHMGWDEETLSLMDEHEIELAYEAEMKQRIV